MMLLAIGCLPIAFAPPLPAAPATVDQRAVKFGTTLPATCYTGDVFFNTAAAAGSNLYACVSPNTWAVQAAGSSGFTTLSGDVNGPANSTTVTQIQGHAIAATGPQTGQALIWNSSSNRWEPQTVSSGGITTLSGDVNGPANSTTVTQIQGHAVASTGPQTGQALIWNSSSNRWEPQTVSSSGITTLSGDVNGPANSTTVTQIQGHPVASTNPQTGQSLVWDGASNRWEPQTVSAGGGSGGGSGGATLASQLADLAAVRTDNATLNVGASCSFTTPCNVRFGAVVYSITSGITVALSGGTGNALIYISNAGMLTVGHTLSLSCSGLCSAQSGIANFPSDVIPLFSWHATNGTWDPTGSDERAFISSKDVYVGAGLIATENSGHTTIAADPTLVALHTTPPVNASDACSAGYWSSDANFYYICIAQNTWRRAALSSW